MTILNNGAGQQNVIHFQSQEAGHNNPKITVTKTIIAPTNKKIRIGDNFR
jgi:hypothetical protein